MYITRLCLKHFVTISVTEDLVDNKRVHIDTPQHVNLPERFHLYGHICAENYHIHVPYLTTCAWLVMNLMFGLK